MTEKYFLKLYFNQYYIVSTQSFRTTTALGNWPNWQPNRKDDLALQSLW